MFLGFCASGGSKIVFLSEIDQEGGAGIIRVSGIFRGVIGGIFRINFGGLLVELFSYSLDESGGLSALLCFGRGF